jgi:hypothetical protein
VSDQQARGVTITLAGNARRIADFPAGGKLHVFNRLFAEDRWTLDVWEYLAGWYQQEPGLRNSEALAPIQPDSAPLAVIRHVRWNMSLPRFISRHCRAFHSFVIANLRVNDIGSLPYLYRQHNGGG